MPDAVSLIQKRLSGCSQGGVCEAGVGQKLGQDNANEAESLAACAGGPFSVLQPLAPGGQTSVRQTSTEASELIVVERPSGCRPCG